MQPGRQQATAHANCQAAFTPSWRLPPPRTWNRFSSGRPTSSSMAVQAAIMGTGPHRKHARCCSWGHHLRAQPACSACLYDGTEQGLAAPTAERPAKPQLQARLLDVGSVQAPWLDLDGGPALQLRPGHRRPVPGMRWRASCGCRTQATSAGRLGCTARRPSPCIWPQLQRQSACERRMQAPLTASTSSSLDCSVARLQLTWQRPCRRWAAAWGARLRGCSARPPPG